MVDLASPEARERIAKAICRAPGSLCRGFCHLRRCPQAIEMHGAEADAALSEVAAMLEEDGMVAVPTEPTEAPPDDIYRVREDAAGFHAEMYYHVKGGARWVPLNSLGNWADPEAYNTGEVTMWHPFQERIHADRALERARRINSDQPIIGGAP